MTPARPPEGHAPGLRLRLGRSSWRLSVQWLSSKSVATLVLFSILVFLGVMYLLLADSGSFSRRKIQWTASPQLETALAAAQERLRVDPQDIATLVEVGTLHFQKGREFYADAINEMEQARELGALDPRIFYCLGIMYQEVGLYPFALEEYQRFLRHYPEDKEIRMLAAKLLYKQGSYAEAVSQYERLRYHFPNDSLIEENLGLSLWGAKELDRAVESFNQLKTMGNDQNRRAEFYLGQIAFDRGQYQEALDHFRRCAPEPEIPEFGIPAGKIHEALGQAYQKLGQWEQARDAWEKAVAEMPDDAKAKTALRDVSRRLPAKKQKTATAEKS